MKYFSTFSGIGGFDLALNRLGHGCVGYSEIDKYAIQIYKKNFGDEVKNYGNARNINTDKLPDFDILCGGFPCQAFSIAGRRKGFEDTRGTLFFEIARIAKSKRPRYLFLENVKGLLSHNKGETFRVILETIWKLGYNVEWGLVNSRYFGVPQNRERVFIIGSLRGESRPKVFPLKSKGGETSANNAIAGIIQLNNPKHSNNRVYDMYGIGPNLNTMQGGMRQPFIKVPEATKKGYATAHIGDSINLSVPSSKTRRGRVGKGIVNTLDTGMNQYTIDIESVCIRRLTPLECERLQGFPDGWTEKGKNFISVKLFGNIWDAVQYKDVKEPSVIDNPHSALCTIKDGKDGALHISSTLSKGKILEGVQYNGAIEMLFAENCVQDTINHGKDMVMLYSQTETLKGEGKIKQSLISELTEGKSTKKLLSLSLEGNWNEERLSTISTLIRETIAKPTSMFAKIDENIIGVIIHLRKSEQNYSSVGSYALKMVSINQISDTQR